MIRSNASSVFAGSFASMSKLSDIPFTIPTASATVVSKWCSTALRYAAYAEAGLSSRRKALTWPCFMP